MEPPPPTRNPFKRFWRWFAPPKESSDQWYFIGSMKNERWWGNYWFHGLAIIIFIAASVVIPAFAFIRSGYSASEAIRWLFGMTVECEMTKIFWFVGGIIWLLVVSVGLPLFLWCERLAFEVWVKDEPHRLNKRDELTAQFELNAKHVEAFWKAVAGLYVAGGLLSFSNLGGGNDDAKVQALANATTTLLIANKLGGQEQPTPETKKAIEALKKAVKEMTESLTEKSPASGNEGATSPVPSIPQSAAKDGASTQEAQGSAPPGSAASQEQ